MVVRAALALCVVVAGAAIAGTGNGAAGGPTSAVRIFVVKETWGPQPFTDSQVDAVMHQVSDYYATASYGQMRLSYDQTPWLPTLSGPPACGDRASALALPPDLAARANAAGYPTSGYQRVVFLIPQTDCQLAGLFNTQGILLNGQFNAPLVAHELGHSFGMGHAGTLVCHRTTTTRFCHEIVYGDVWDVMGGSGEDAAAEAPSNAGDFGALQKARAGWLTDYVTLTKPGVYRVAALEDPAPTAPRALVIHTTDAEYWIDHREPIGNDAYLASDPFEGAVNSGFEVHRAPSNVLASQPDFPVSPDYLERRGPSNSYFTPPGATLTVPGILSLKALSVADGVVSMRFRWADTTRPSRPVITRVATTALQLTLAWRPSRDRGTGVAHYVVLIDGRQADSVTAGEHLATVMAASPGLHRIGIAAVDYAGNQSATSWRRVTLR